MKNKELEYFKNFGIKIEQRDTETLCLFGDSTGFILVQDDTICMTESPRDSHPVIFSFNEFDKMLFNAYKNNKYALLNTKSKHDIPSLEFQIDFSKGIKENNIPKSLNNDVVVGLLMARLINFIKVEVRRLRQKQEKRNAIF